MRNSLLFPFLVCAFFAHAAFSAELGENDYLNNYEVPVLIKVPYYEKDSKEAVPFELMLQPGDLYKSRSGKNGLVYANFAKIEKALAEHKEKNAKTPVVSWSDGRKNADKEYEKYLEDLKADVMPKEWVDNYRSDYTYELEQNKRQLDQQEDGKKNGGWFDEEYYMEALTKYAVLTNFHSRIDDLTNPASDPDQDGLDNRTEYARGTSPIFKDYVSAYPGYVEIKYDNSSNVTGTFYLVNTAKESKTISLENVLYQWSDLYKMHFVTKKGELKGDKITLPPESETKIDLYFKADAAPRYFDDAFSTVIYTTNEFGRTHFEIKLHSYEDKSKPLTIPKNKKPAEGTLYEGGEALTFSWEEPGLSMKQDRYERINYKLFLASPFNDVRGSNEISVKKHRNFKAGAFGPGVYFWRVGKQDRFHEPVSSPWSWFAVGKEVGPVNEKQLNRGDPRHEHWPYSKAFLELYFIFAGEPYELNIGNLDSTENSHFPASWSDPKQEVSYGSSQNGESPWKIKGSFDAPGLYSNLWLDIDAKGETNEIWCFFIVRQPPYKRIKRSYYDPDTKVVMHDLFKNLSFNFNEKEYFEALSKKEGLDWETADSKEFIPSLPDGLKANKIADGDIEISGAPTVDGVFTNIFKVTKGDVCSEETHIFNIKDIGEPPFEIEYALKDKYRHILLEKARKEK